MRKYSDDECVCWGGGYKGTGFRWESRWWHRIPRGWMQDLLKGTTVMEIR